MTPGREHGFELRGLQRTITATRVDNVVAALAEAEAASAGGAWVAGFVAYEAAPGLSDDFVVVPGHRPSNEPLVWFGVFDRRMEVEPVRAPAGVGHRLGPFAPTLGPQRHHEAVIAIRDGIADGDVYQVNLTDRLVASFDGDPFALYATMAAAQRGAYNAYLDIGDLVVASVSPELFVRRDGDRLVMRPMKGTAARGRWAEDDLARAAALRSTLKERAENVMIVDLVRNDLAHAGGFVTVDELFAVEQYPTVWQMTSQVSATGGGHLSLVSLFRALFPSGSVTGAPKISAMRRIASLEAGPRGIYCGAVGFIAPGGDFCFNVAIRTAVYERSTGVVTYGSGGGITWDSSATAEHAELVMKTRVVRGAHPPPDLFETMRWTPDEGVAWLDDHLSRLQSSARYFGIPFDRAEAESLVKAISAPDAPQRVRLVLWADGHLSTSVAVAPGGADGPVRLAVDTTAPIASADARWFHKTVERSRYDDRRRRFAAAGVDDIVLVNEAGEVTETTIANLAVSIDGVWYTPPLSSGCLPGVFRARAVREGRVVERVMTVRDLRRADGVAVMNALRGWRPAILLP
ncbi:MAG: chorismate-binding protein [Acidimicrobiia bacterium]